MNILITENQLNSIITKILSEQMEKVTITAIVEHNEDYALIFSDGSKLYSEHKTECCEFHYLDLTSIDLNEVEKLNFDLSGDDFFNRIPEYGIELLPLNGHPIRIPGYGENSGNYDEDLSLVLDRGNGDIRRYDVEDCQTIKQKSSH